MTVSALLAHIRRIKRQSQPKVVLSIYAFGKGDEVAVRIIMPDAN